MALRSPTLVGTALLATVLAAWQPLAMARASHQLDALDANERASSANLVRDAMLASRPAARSAQRANAPANELQLLLVERRPSKDPSAARLADVFHYDYLQNELVHCVVDVDSQQILRADRQPGVQLPLVETELQRAIFILLASPPQRGEINRAYRRITGRALRGIQDIDYKAFVFHADSTIAGVAAGAAACGTNRCAQLLLYTHDNIALDLSPIVDLSRGRVADVLRPQGQAASSATLTDHNDTH